MSDPHIDSIYSQYRERVPDFVFDENVVSVFDDMIRRSVPGYATVIAMTKVFAQHYSQPNSNCYDLGSSLGASTVAMRRGIDKPNCKIISVDNSEAMVSRCREIVASEVSDVAVDVVLADIGDIEIQRASVVVMNYTLQFFKPENRDSLLKRIYDGMLDGGAILLSEKVEFSDTKEQDFQLNMHLDFKRLNGYSETEVAQKRKSLDNVLISDSIKTHFERLESVGFKNVYLWFQCFNFVSIVAFK